MTIQARLTHATPTEDLLWLGPLVVLQLGLIALYFTVSTSTPTNVRYVLYPLIWINVGLWAIVRTRTIESGRRTRLIALSVATVYGLVLFVLTGLIGPSAAPPEGTGFRLAMHSPGWGPVVSYVGETFHLTLVPYVTIGYVALSYLVYAAMLEATKGALSGVIGLASCVGCTFPVLLALFGAGGSTMATTVFSLSMEISTAVFVLAIGLLYWRKRLRVPRFR